MSNVLSNQKQDCERTHQQERTTKHPDGSTLGDTFIKLCELNSGFNPLPLHYEF